MYIDSGSFLISLGCCLSSSQLLAIMFVQWYYFSTFSFLYLSVCGLLFKVVSVVIYGISLLMQMTVLTVYIFLYGRVYLVSPGSVIMYILMSYGGKSYLLV